MADIHDEILSAVMSELGRRGGSARTPRKRASSARNLAAYWQRRAAEQAPEIPAIWSLGPRRMRATFALRCVSTLRRPSEKWDPIARVHLSSRKFACVHLYTLLARRQVSGKIVQHL
jgi:hypothetical protein